MKHFSELTSDEVNMLCEKLITSAIEYAGEIGMSGLSHNGVHDIYEAIRLAITEEWIKSRNTILASNRKDI